jgi:hypothetical protein
MLKTMLVSCLMLILLSPASGAKLFENPEAVNYLHAQVYRQGSVTLESTGFGARATRLEIRHSAPQETLRQSSEIKSVEGPDDYHLDRDDFGNEIIVLTWNDPPIQQPLQRQPRA